MNKIQLFRRRYIPDEIKELKDDVVLSADDKMILTKWNVLKPRKDIARGVSVRQKNDKSKLLCKKGVDSNKS